MVSSPHYLVMWWELAPSVLCFLNLYKNPRGICYVLCTHEKRETQGLERACKSFKATRPISCKAGVLLNSHARKKKCLVNSVLKRKTEEEEEEGQYLKKQLQKMKLKEQAMNLYKG